MPYQTNPLYSNQFGVTGGIIERQIFNNKASFPNVNQFQSVLSNKIFSPRDRISLGLGSMVFSTVRLGEIYVPTNEVCDPFEFLDGVARVTPYGTSGWAYAIDGTSGHPGQIRVDSSSTSGGSAGFYSPSSLILAAGFSIEFVFYVGNDATGTIVRFGLSDSTSGTADPTNGVFFEYSKAVSANIRYRARKASVSTETTTGTAFALSAWKKGRITYDGTNATFEYGTSGGSYSKLGTIAAANLPTAAIHPWFFVTQASAGAYTYADVDFMWPRMWGLAR